MTPPPRKIPSLLFAAALLTLLVPTASAAAPTSAPTVTGSSGGTQYDPTIQISWTAVAGATSYSVWYSTTSHAATTPMNASAYAYLGSTGGLSAGPWSSTEGYTLHFRVLAANSAGEGPVSPDVAVTAHYAAPTPPGLPKNPQVVTIAATSTSVGWSAPDSTGGSPITSYVVTVCPSSTSVCSQSSTTIRDTGSTATSATFSGLASSTRYIWFVYAKNNVGNGNPVAGPAFTTSAASSPTPPPSSPTPSAPTTSPTPSSSSPAPASAPTITGHTTGTANDPQIWISWTAVTGATTYDVWWSADNHASTTPMNASAYTYLGTTNGFSTQPVSSTEGYTIHFRVLAANAGGEGPVSPDFALTAHYTGTTIPGPPRTPVVVSTSSDAATLSWTAPESNGGASISGYVVTYCASTTSVCSQSASTTLGVTTTSASLRSLTPNTRYIWFVYAKNSAGNGNPAAGPDFTAGETGSAPSNPLTPPILEDNSTGNATQTSPPTNAFGIDIPFPHFTTLMWIGFGVGVVLLLASGRRSGIIVPPPIRVAIAYVLPDPGLTLGVGVFVLFLVFTAAATQTAA